MPAAVVNKLSAAVVAVIRQPETRSRLLDVGWQTAGTAPEALSNRMRADTAQLGEIIRSRGIKVDGYLEDDQRIVLAGDPPFPVRVVFTPGHARGHVGFFAEESASFLAGDLVAGVGTIVVDPPEGDMDDYLASLDKARALAPNTLFPAHGPAVKDAAGYLATYKEHRLWREGKVKAAWREGKRSAKEMLPVVYDDVPKEASPIAERQILAHLERLKRAGKLVP